MNKIKIKKKKRKKEQVEEQRSCFRAMTSKCPEDFILQKERAKLTMGWGRGRLERKNWKSGSMRRWLEDTTENYAGSQRTHM
jgi:hypothetical protein